MNIFICSDSFKGTIEAWDVVRIISSVFEDERSVTCRTMPLADGGEGSIEIINTQINCVKVNLKALNPIGHLIDGFYLRSGHTAYIDIANVGGLHLLKSVERNPLRANTYGTGQLIAHAIANQCQSIILFLGGSATVDGGSGLMQAICNSIFHSTNPLLSECNIAINDFKQRIQNIDFTIVTDVENTIIGNEGAARVFGPQKGADAASVLEIDKAMIKWLNVLQQYTDKDLSMYKGLGAAGGVAVPFVALNQHVQLINGFDYFNHLLDYESSINWADVVITGEGCIDEQTMMGKGPGRIAKMSNELGKRVIGVGGIVTSYPKDFEKIFATTDLMHSESELKNKAVPRLLGTALQIKNYLFPTTNF